MRSLAALVLAVTTAVACSGRSCGGSRASTTTSDAQTPAALGAATGADTANDRFVVHDCVGLAPEVTTCADARAAAPADPLVVGAELLTEIPARHNPPPEEWWSRLDVAMELAEQARLESLGVDERVAVQNAALFVALAAEHAEQHARAVRAMALVRRLAFPAGARPESLDADPGLARWLGPQGAWVERTRAPHLFHELVHANTRVFRLVRTPALHANFSQLIAVDDRGAPFVTRVVGSIEVRRGTSQDAPACVALSSPARLRCGQAAGLEVADVPHLPKNHFFTRDDRQRLACNGCHGAAGTMADDVLGTRDLAPADVPSDLATRRQAVLDETTKGLSALWSAR